MKIEKLNKENINEFIKSMNLDDDALVSDINKREYYGVKDDANYLIGFVIEPDDDVITIKYDNAKVNSDSYLSIIKFLNENMVVKNHLIIKVFNSKRMKVLDDRYKCKEESVCLALDGNIEREDITGQFLLREKFIDVEMKSIKYYYGKEMVICNLVKQNIQDEKVIGSLHEKFSDLNIKYLNFTIFPDSFDYFKELGYQCMGKSYVVKDDLF